MRKTVTRLFACVAGLWFPAVVCAALLAWSAGGCSVSTEGIEFFGGDYQVPEIHAFRVCDEYAVELEMSKDVSLEDAQICIVPEGSAVSSFALLAEHTFDSLRIAGIAGNGTQSLRLTFSEQMEIGRRYILYGRLRDGRSNSLTVAVPFTGYNYRPPKVLINEIQSFYSGSAKTKRIEFAELYVLEDGNLGGLELLSVRKGDKAAYSFPALEVKAGEYITLHYRVLAEEEDVCVDETGCDVAESGGSYSCVSARDFWFAGNAKRIDDDADVLILRTADGRILDGVPYCKKAEKWTDALAESVEGLVRSGVWDSSAPYIDAEKNTATTSLSRQNQNVPSSALDWIVVASNNATPGEKNSANAKK